MATSLSIPTVILAGAILLVYFAILLKYSSTIRNAAFLEKFVVAFFILLLADAFQNIAVLSKLSPNHILTEGKPPGVSFIVITITFFVTLLTLNLKLRFLFKEFLRGLTYFVLYNPFLTILILLTPISAFWSMTPLFTLARGLIFVGVTIAAIYIGSCYQWGGLFKILRLSFAFAMIQSMFLALLVPSIGVSGKGWQGSFEHAGTLGLYAALTSMLWLIQLFTEEKNRLLNAVILGLSLLVLKQTNSATGLILFVQGVGMILAINLVRKLRPRLGFVVTFVSIPLAILATYSLSHYYYNLLAVLDKSPDLTGRGEFWPQLIQVVIKRPILGYGFEGFWLPWKGKLNPAANIFNSNFYVPPHAHNGFLDLAISLGLVGLVLFAVAYLSCAIRAFQSFRVNQTFAVVPLVLLMFIGIANTSGPGLWVVGFHSFLLVLVSTRLTLDTMQSSTKSAHLF